MDDRELIAAWQSGRPEAARTLVDRYYGAMLNLFYRLAGTRERAEELTQELFVRLTRTVRSGQRIDNLAGWLYRVGYNLWRDWVRRTVTARVKGIPAQGGDDEIARMPALEEVEAIAITRWEQESVREAMLALSPSHREVIVLCYYEGLSYEEIASITSVPVGTVRSRLYYAIRQLRTHLNVSAERGRNHG